MSRRRPAAWALSVLLCAALVTLLTLRWPRADRAPRPSRPSDAPRVISLAPAITETLLALGAGAWLVGVSDYCQGSELGERPRVGTSITPHLEAVARLEPTLILTSQVAGEQMAPLSRIAPTHQLPWLTLNEVVPSVRELGRLVERPAEGDALATRLEETLSATPPPNAPQVLLTMSYGDTGGTDVWFIRDNSLHGALLRAAGGANAEPRQVTGQPRLSVEQLLKLNPDLIILLVDADRTSAAEAEKRQAPLRNLTPLRAVRQNKLGILRAPNVFSGGPRILDLVEPLRREIRRLDGQH